MPLREIIPKKIIDSELKTIEELQVKCNHCKLLNNKKVDDIYIYKICEEYITEDGDAMIAVAKYGTTYAVHLPKYLKDNQLVVLNLFMSELDLTTDTLVVFSEYVLSKVTNYMYGKKIKVCLGI